MKKQGLLNFFSSAVALRLGATAPDLPDVRGPNSGTELLDCLPLQTINVV